MSKIRIRKVDKTDAKLLMEASKQNKPLDIHTLYTYWVMCNYSTDYTYKIFIGNDFAGYIMCISNKNTILIWQICIAERYRKMGLAQMLIEKIYKIAKSENKTIQFTVLENNVASLEMFTKFCHKHNLVVKNIGKILEETECEEMIYQFENPAC